MPTPSHAFGSQDSGDCLDQLTTLTFVTADTTFLRLLTSLMVIPHRPPMLSAKMVATLDILSRGRVTVGIGAGCMEEKINLLRVLKFKRRGKLVYETLAAMRTFWTDADPVFEVEFVSFSDLEFELKPVQKQHLPIRVGGEA
ncbi:MAG: LLM class flavin-dependent oxidoreductase [Pseudomonadota bacterium]|nr:LLM class flavin-dependent oxidoreductase [Pseudomonadota bacterium]